MPHSTDDQICLHHLNQVSRSFALCIPFLKTPVNRWVSYSYLAFRILDSIEDAPWESLTAQERSFQIFLRLFEEFREEDFFHWKKEILDQHLPLEEKDLLDFLPVIIRELTSMPHINEFKVTLHKMHEGMVRFLSRNKKISNEEELEDYCESVAGIIGTLLLEYHDLRKENHLYARSFGRFLQKVNILKDQAEDEARGKVFIFDKDSFLILLDQQKKESELFLESIKSHQEFFDFSQFSFELALLSLGKTLSNKEFGRADVLRLIRG